MPLQEDSESGYLSYMLRMWLRRDSKGELVWSASLEAPGSRHMESFGDIGALFAFLRSCMDAEMLGVTSQQDLEGAGDE